ncbi:MAG: hypothetical protein PWQ06_2597 [Anaerophaga sp.]|nr:hypothetical protein [Anaerophaga sp.]
MEQIVLIASFLVPLVLSAVIFHNGRGNTSKKILSFCMLNAAAVFIANYYYFIRNFEIYTFMHSAHVALVLFIYPSLYFYLSHLTGKLNLSKKMLIHLIPGFLFFILYFFFFDIKFSHTERIEFLNTYRDELFAKEKFRLIEWILIINIVFIILQVIYYSALIFVESHRYNTRIKNEFSNAENLQIKWLSWFNIALIAVAILSVLFYVVNPFSDANNILLIVSMFVMSVFIWLIGIWGNAQSVIELPCEEAPESWNDNNYETLYSKLLNSLVNDKLYLNPDLTLSELSRTIGTNRTYASKAINAIYKGNFSSFVNAYRVEVAKTLLKENPDLKMKTIAEQSGFGSVLTFERNFAKYTGTLPGKIKKASHKKR